MKDAFISYVHEDIRLVGFLAEILRMNGINVWLDKEKLLPGVRWKDAIRGAIRNGAFFISIHSKQRESRTASYANEELTLAIDELRKRPTNKTWFIPVRIDDCDIEDRSIGGGETLGDLHRCDLTDWPKGLRSLLEGLGVVDPILDHGVPLADGLPSFVKISSGYIRYEVLPGMPEHLQGLEFRVKAGWCQRQEDNTILAYMETVAPIRSIQEMNMLLGLSGFYAKTNDYCISQNSNSPTVFGFDRLYTLPSGSEVIDFSNGKKAIIPIDLPISTRFSASGAIHDLKFSGSFNASVVSQHPMIPFSIEQNGEFEMIFSVTGCGPIC